MSDVAAPDDTISTIANLESEFSLLATLLADNARIEKVSDTLKQEDFSEPFFGRMFGLICREYGAGAAVNVLTIRPLLEADPGYQSIGAQSFLASLTGSAALMFDTAKMAQQILDFAVRRRLIAGLTAAIEVANDLDEPLARIIDVADGAVVASSDRGDAIRQPTGAQAMRQLLISFKEPKRSIHSKIIPSVDSLLGGMRAKQLVIGAGRPGMGKTAAALSYALGAAQNGHGVLFVTLEMSATELAARMAADLSFDGRRVFYADINSDSPSKAANEAVFEASELLDDLAFHVIDAGSLSIGRLEMIVRRYKRRLAAKGQSLDLVVVDYLQLLRTDEKGRSNYEVVSEISRRLKGIAKDYDLAVFALAQLSREVEKRADKRPVLSDLRDSGQIEQDADAVLFLYRHEYYLRKSQPEANSPDLPKWQQSLNDCAGMIDFICAKRRNGPEGSATGYFHGAYQAVRG